VNLSKATQTDTVVAGGNNPYALTNEQLERARQQQRNYEYVRNWINPGVARLFRYGLASSRIPREAK